MLDKFKDTTMLWALMFIAFMPEVLVVAIISVIGLVSWLS